MLTQYQKWMSMQNHFKVSAQRNPKCWFCSSGCEKHFFTQWNVSSTENATTVWDFFWVWTAWLPLNVSISFFFFWMIEHTSRRTQRNAQAMPEEKKKSYISCSKGLNMLNVHNSTIRNDLFGRVAKRKSLFFIKVMAAKLRFTKLH